MNDKYFLVASSEPVLVPTPHGLFAVSAFEFGDGTEHLLATAVGADGRPLSAGEHGQAHLVRLHSECATGDLLGSYRCDCGPQLEKALATVQDLGGSVLYLRGQEGRGIGLVNKLRAYALQDSGADTLDANLQLGFPADARDYTQAALILKAAGLTRVRLLTNNPAKAEALTELGVQVTGLVPDVIAPRPENERYLATKRDRMRHILDH
ncbi:GTP cyclohydrolase II RibA [Rothia nasisuis]|uniref:GTP cyclohydrolase II RibA n=1 Tax=Rothia nasisuis TaxID=2109647 RepID=UPI001F4320AD|nr:GTP cyclohydrolase II RibA [Rothia nasisuis]